MKHATIAALCLLLGGGVLAQEGDSTAVRKKMFSYSEFTGEIEGSYRYFPEESLYPGQHEEYFSSAFQPKLYLEWNDGKQSFNFQGFARLDQYDNQRTHADIREMYWQKVFRTWEMSVGLKKIFWGVTESNHLVDIINQSDGVEGFDLEQKLGQPMVHLSFAPSWGTVDMFILSYFRELTFPGEQGRLRPPFQINYDDVTFESDNEEWQPEFALRWSNSISVFDIGLSHFYGTSRTPIFNTVVDTSFNISFTPHYELINQSAIDLQASTGSMLWKVEAIHRESKRKTITAITAGGEYTFSNLFRSGIDVGILAEYLFDDRGQELITGFNNDIFLAARIALNDKQSTDFLGGVTIDRDTDAQLLFAQANRRLGETWKVSLDYSGFGNIPEDDFLYLIRKDGFVQVTLIKYF